VLKDASSLKTVLERTVQSVRPSDIFWISHVVPLGPRLPSNFKFSKSILPFLPCYSLVNQIWRRKPDFASFTVSAGSTVASLDCVTSCLQAFCRIQHSLSKCPNISPIYILLYCNSDRAANPKVLFVCALHAPLLYIRPLNTYHILIYIQDRPLRLSTA
jgi:hypothetical protein